MIRKCEVMPDRLLELIRPFLIGVLEPGDDAFDVLFGH